MKRETEDEWEWRLPQRDLRGRYLISGAALDAAERLLPTYRGADGDHEGIVLLLGYETVDVTLILAVAAPDADHGRGRVIVSGGAVGSATEVAHRHGLAVLGQIHTHPGGWTEHSEGDDDLVLMQFDGMLSIVAPNYARFGLRPLHSLGVHQRQDGAWFRVSTESLINMVTIVPAGFDVRPVS